MSEVLSAESALYQVVARRYRPKNFEELVGQKHIAQALSNAITSGRIGHAYLFTGARGVGKTSSARIFAKALNCAHGPTITPCGICDSCIAIGTGEDIDVLEYDAASNRGIEDIREIRQNASIRPSRSKFKIYILDEVHMLTEAAFNALLKILEEPPEHVKFIFCTTDPQKVPITILSRVQRFDFAGIDPKQISQRLADIAANEKVTADDGVFDTLARRAAGSMRDAQSLLEQLLSFAKEHITLQDINEMLGTADDQLLFRLLDNVLQCENEKILTELDTAASEGVDFAVLTEQLMGVFRDLMVAVSGGNASLLLTISPPQFEEVKTRAADFGIHRILAALQILDQANTKMQRSTQVRLLTELALVRIAHLDHFQQIAVLLEELKTGQPIPAVCPAQRIIPPPKESTVHNQQLSALNPQLAWQTVADNIPGMLGSAAAQAVSICFEKPNVCVAVFNNAISMKFCEKEAPRLQGALSQQLGTAMKVRFELIDAARPSEASPAVPPSRNALMTAALESPIVQQIQNIFGARLQRVE